MEGIGQKIESERKKKGMSRNKLAQLIGLTTPALRKLEKGITKNITLEVSKKLAKALNVVYDDFFYIEEEERANTLWNISMMENCLRQYMENIDVVKLSTLKLLAAFSDNPKLPNEVNPFIDMSAIFPGKYCPYAYIEFKWQVLKRTGVFREEDMDSFISQHGSSYPKLVDWFRNNRIDESELRLYIPEYEFYDIHYDGFLNYATEFDGWIHHDFSNRKN